MEKKIQDDCMDAGGTTPGTGEVGRRREPPPRATQGAVAEGFNVTQYLAELAGKLDRAQHGERGHLVSTAAKFLCWSDQRVYNQLKRRCAWNSGRKPRADKGTTAQPLDALKVVGSMQRQSVRKNGKLVLHLPTALSIAATNGKPIAVSRGRFGRLLRDRKLDARSQSRDRPAQSMRSLHPNHLHQVDPSLCLVYYLNGEQQIMRDDKFYKNKLENYARVLLKVWRYVLHDHAASEIIPWYVEAKGETSANLFEFLMFAWGKQRERAFHGAPKLLMLDPGSANTAHTTKNFIAALGTKLLVHKPGAARVKGGVENAQNIIETKFESRLKFEPVNSVEELNAAAFAWSNAFNANLIPYEDTRLHRPGLPEPVARNDLWLTIKDEELRVLPDREKCKLFLEGKTVTRKVNAKLEISYAHPLADGACTYDLRGLDGICIGDTVEVSPLAIGECEVYVRASRYDGAALEYRVKPAVFDPVYGFRADAPVWGEEYRVKPDTEVERSGKELDRMAFAGRTLEEIERAKDKNKTPFDGKMVAHSHLQNIVVPTSLAARRGSEITMPDRARVEEEKLAGTGALIHVVRALGRKLEANERSAFDAFMAARADGATAAELDAWLDEFRQAPEVAPDVPALRVVK